MAVSKNAAGTVVNKMFKGLKGFKKAEKEKNAAKRATIARIAKEKKMNVAPQDEMFAEINDVAAVTKTEDLLCIAQDEKADPQEHIAEADVSYEDSAASKIPEKQVDNMEGAIGINPVISTETTVAPRADIPYKADKVHQINQKLNPIASMFIVSAFTNIKLNPPAKDFNITQPTLADTPRSTIFHEETVTTLATPESMEIPLERCVACRYIPSVDAECHYSDEAEIVEETPSMIKWLHNNGVENIPLFTGSKSANMKTSNLPISSLSVDGLFSEVSATGVARIGVAELSNNFMLDSTDPWACTKAVSNLSPLAEALYPSIRSRVSRSLEVIEEKMQTTTRSGSSYTVPFADRAMSCKIEQQSPPNADHQSITNPLSVNSCTSTTSDTTSYTTRMASPILFNPNVQPFSPLTPPTASP